MNIEKLSIEGIMTRDVVSFHPKMIMLDIVNIIEDSKFHHFPVIDDNEVCVGVLSKSDYLQIQDKFTKFGHSTAEVNNRMLMRSLLVSEVMTTPAITAEINSSVDSIIQLFLKNEHRSVVITEDGKSIGIVTPIDILKSISEASLVTQ